MMLMRGGMAMCGGGIGSVLVVGIVGARGRAGEEAWFVVAMVVVVVCV